jgi:hypothetical protein
MPVCGRMRILIDPLLLKETRNKFWQIIIKQELT